MDAVKKIDAIERFRGENAFLSNFQDCKISFDGLVFDNAEAAFQAQKTENLAERKGFMGLTASNAKREGRHVDLRRDWESIKVMVMERVVSAKFRQDPQLSKMLLATGSARLVEGNNWNDTFWGVCNGRGRNELGRILMAVRHMLASEKSLPGTTICLEMSMDDRIMKVPAGRVNVALYCPKGACRPEDAVDMLKKALRDRKNELEALALAYKDDPYGNMEPWSPRSAICLTLEDMQPAAGTAYQVIPGTAVQAYSF